MGCDSQSRLPTACRSHSREREYHIMNFPGVVSGQMIMIQQEFSFLGCAGLVSCVTYLRTLPAE
jgi:hypothetical protein